MQNSKTFIRCSGGFAKEYVLVCFPFAGGSASAYKNWMQGLNYMIDVCAIQLPGREDRIMEKPYKDMVKLVADITEEIERLNKKVILFGHSMGGKIAYEVAKKMEECGKGPKLLIVSGSRVPNVPEPNPVYQLSDDDFLEAIKRFNGMPREITEDRDLLNFFLPMLRADFELDEKYYSEDAVVLNCPIIAFGGTEDTEADEDDISKWASFTLDKFAYKVFDGGHFFIKQKENEVIDYVRVKIQDCV